jgi:phenylacetate-CoA ligase
LGVEGMPLLRYKTGDIVKPFYEACKCGRNTMRLGPIIGRKKQMVKYKGTTLYPPVIYNLLNDFDEIKNYVVEISTNEYNMDEILFKIGTKEPSERLEKKIKDHFRAKLRVAPQILFLPIDEINLLQFPKMSRKPIIFIDNRNL